MSIELHIAHGTFLRIMDVILASVKWQIVLVFLSDIVVFIKTLQQHIDHVQKVLSILHNASATIILKDCKFFTDTIDHRSHIIRQKCLGLDSHTTNFIDGPKPPANNTELRFFSWPLKHRSTIRT